MLEAEDFTSPNFILRDPVITPIGGRSTSSSFELFSSSSNAISGESTSSSFKSQFGFLYFDQAAVTVVTPPPPSVVSGGSVPSSGSKATFSGKGYPKATVLLLKDAQIVSTVLADENANFRIEVGGLTSADYVFSLYAKDYTGKASRLVLFPLKIGLNTVTDVANVVNPPTISKDKKEVERGETIDFFGQLIANSRIFINIEGPEREFSVQTNSDKDGKYQYTLDTSSLDFGSYKAYSQVSFGDTVSLSSPVDFIIGTKTVLEKTQACPLVGDLNDDCSVNLVDFSILIYWFNKPNVPSKVDLNDDKKADLVDFSIMAYYWTG